MQAVGKKCPHTIFTSHLRLQNKVVPCDSWGGHMSDPLMVCEIMLAFVTIFRTFGNTCTVHPSILHVHPICDLAD